MTEPTCVHCGLTFLQHDNHDCQGDWSAMTEPKHIPLPKRWSDSAVERLVHWLQTPDEAQVPLDDDVTEEDD